MNTINERIAELIKALGITRIKFGESIGITSGAVTQICNGKVNPSTPTIAGICHIYNVNEEWLVNGTGEMFVPQTRYEEIATFFSRLSAEPVDSFKVQLISVLSRLPEDKWQALAEIARDLAEQAEQSENSEQ